MEVDNVEGYDNTYNFKFASAGEITVVRKDGELFFYSFEKYPDIVGRGKPITPDNIVSFKDKDVPPGLAAELRKAVKRKDDEAVEEEKAKQPQEKKYAYEEGAGFPVIVCNYNGSKPISGDALNFLDEKNPELKKKIQDMIPEGHAFLIVIDPRSRSPKLINFGVYSESEGGHAECVEKGKLNAEESFAASVFNAAGFSLIGSLTVKNLGGEIELKKSGKNYVFLNDDVINQILDSPSCPGDSGSIEYAVIDGCTHINKTLATAKVNKCQNYNVLPKSVVASMASTLKSFAELFSDIEVNSSMKSPSGDNCSTMTYKLAYIAKNGSQPSRSESDAAQLPTEVVSVAKSNI